MDNYLELWLCCFTSVVKTLCRKKQQNSSSCSPAAYRNWTAAQTLIFQFLYWPRCAPLSLWIHHTAAWFMHDSEHLKHWIYIWFCYLDSSFEQGSSEQCQEKRSLLASDFLIFSLCLPCCSQVKLVDSLSSVEIFLIKMCRASKLITSSRACEEHSDQPSKEL